MSDKTLPVPPGINCPYDYVAITPSDTADLPFVTQAIWVGVAGHIALRNPAGVSVLFKNVPASSTAGPFIIGTRRVMATGTTATDLVALSQ